MTQPHLLLIDGLNFVRRIYEANQAPDSPEKADGAIKAVKQSFRRALLDHAPSHCLWAFDHGGPTWRHAHYSDYKAGRKPMAAALQHALVGFCDELANLGWAIAAYPGFEAEDTIASASVHARALGAKVTALSTDKDVLCLLEYGVDVHDHFARVSRDNEYCIGKFGVPGHQVLEVLALWGDAVDGVPGVDKVGVKTAAKLIQEFGTVDGVLAAAAGISGVLGEQLRSQADRARLSRVLVELRYDVFGAVGEDFDMDELTVGAS